MTRMPRVRMSTRSFALTVGLAICLVSPPMLAMARQAAPVEVGSGPVRERALALTGRNIYHPDTVDMFGYLTSVIGLDPGLLFTDDPPSERTARFTYAGSVSVSSRSDRGDVTAFQGAGVLRIFLDDDAGASWDDPASFTDGQMVAELSLSLRDTLHRQAPGVGVVVGDGRLVQETAGEFTVVGQEYRFGNPGIEQRLHYVGALLAGAAEPPSLAVSLTGNASVAVREAIPVNVGQAPTTAATPLTQDCPDLQPWLDQTRDRLTQALDLAAGAEATSGVTSLDAEVVRRVAAEMASLRERQRGITAPEGAAEANRLVVTAFSTYARGLEVIADAAAAEDADLLAQGQAVVADGSRLLERAVLDVAALADACPGSPESSPESA